MALQGFQFMREDLSMLPGGLLTQPKMLPFQKSGLGLFNPWAPQCVSVKCDRVSVKCDDKCMPVRKTKGAAGYDLCSQSSVTIAAGSSAILQTGVSIEFPEGYFGKIEGRSSLAIRHGVVAFGGVIDEDYRGTITVKLFNHSRSRYKIQKHDRIAQLIIQKYEAPQLVRIESLSETKRGASGFGSTGK